MVMADNPTELDVIVRERALAREGRPAEPKPIPGWTGVDRPAPRDPASPTEAPRPVTPPRAARSRPGLIFHLILALLALVGAAIALAAPALRPWLLATAPGVMGVAPDRVAAILRPETDADRALADLLPRIAAIETEFLRARLETRALERRLLDSIDAGRETRERAAAALEASARAEQAVADLTRDSSSLERRLRASNLMTATLRLRRDLDTGAPLADGVALLTLLGGFPPDVTRAIATLRDMPDGVASMRDLALGFEALDQAIAADIGQDASGWSRLRALFSGGDDPRLSFLRRARDLASEGRMTEVATLLTHSPWRAQTRDWVDRVAARNEASLAVRTLGAYALAQAAAAHDKPGVERR
jgi:hypothetical protein